MLVSAFATCIYSHGLTRLGITEAVEIGVISPYRMQVRAIRRSLREESLGDVTVGSVEQFQGQVNAAVCSVPGMID